MADLTPMIAAASGNASTALFKCVGIHDLPFHGNEILVIEIIYLALACVYAVTFIDVALKQTWPSKFLDSVVFQRVAKLKEDFPGITNKQQSRPMSVTSAEEASETDPLGLDDESQWDPVIKATKQDGTLTTIPYNKIVSQEPYVASCCVDEDITFMLANEGAFGTISDYCSCTVRGYALLSTILPMACVSLGFLWIHNAVVFPIGDNYARYFTVVGYFLGFLTANIMITPSRNMTVRNRNILLWDSIALPNWLENLHDYGIVGWALVPMLANLYQVIAQPVPGHQLPNRQWIIVGIVAQVIGLVAFEGPSLLHKFKVLTENQSKQLGYFGEVLVLFASFLTFVQIETYSAAACANYVSTMGYLILGTPFAVFAALCVKHYAGAPVAPYANGPSVLLMNGDAPVATSGTVPVLNYNRQTSFLPTVQPQ